MSEDNYSAYIYMNPSSKVDDIYFVFFKTSLEADAESFAPLKHYGTIFKWKKDVDRILSNSDDDLDELDRAPQFVLGCGHDSQHNVEWIYALQWSEGIFVIGDNISIEKNSVTINNASFWYGDDDVTPDGETIDNLEITLSSASIDQIKLLENTFNRFVHYEHDDDEQATLRLKDKRTKLLKGFDADKPVYTRNWDDLDDLEGLSSAWTIALSF